MTDKDIRNLRYWIKIYKQDQFRPDIREIARRNIMRTAYGEDV